MKNHRFAKVSLGCLLCLIMFLTGCINIGSCAMQAKYQRTVQLSAPLSPGSAFEAQTHNGSITINGAEVAECNMTATIVARAATDEEAQELAEKVKVTLVLSGNRLITRIDKPTQLINKSVSVDLDVEVPNQTDLKLVTHNGSVEISDIKGRVDASTNNGSINTDLPITVSGKISKSSLKGTIGAGEGQLNLETYNGSIRIR